jgi:hypothetical protein
LPGLNNSVGWNGNCIGSVGYYVAANVHGTGTKIHKLNKLARGIASRPWHKFIDHYTALPKRVFGKKRYKKE